MENSLDPPVSNHGFKKFISVGHQEASRKKVPLTGLRSSSDVYIKHLWLTDDQLAQVQELYVKKVTSNHVYTTRTDEQQIAAASLLAQLALDLDAQNSLGNRWSIRWSRKTGRKGQETRRALYQCDCGYDHEARKSKLRRCPVNFTSCLAHVEVLSKEHTGKVLRICGYFEHNQECKDAFLARIPPIPLHPSVFAHALKQLQIGAQLADIEAENRRMFQACQYPSQPRAILESSYRWLIRKSDTRSLYRQFNRLRGIHTATAAHINVDDWLDPASPAYNPIFADAVFHYSPRASKHDRFEVCIATEEMRNAAWKYAHASQLILDGTFGLCDRKLLLFILMGVDEKKRGVPLAFLLFSAPSGNQQTSSGYNTEVLTRLLGGWRDSLGVQDGRSFAPQVAITDTDLKECGALLKVFKDIWLLLCKFHVRQSWRNHRSRELRGQTQYHTDIHNRLRRLEAAMLETRSHDAAQSLVAEERQTLEKLRVDEPVSEAAVAGAIQHLDYLLNYWLDVDLWKSWSLYGREFAAELLRCEVDGVLPTTNHLESFNGVLKRKHLRRWQRGGRRLRVDVLLHVIVFSILPAIFEARRLDSDEDARIATQIRSLPGGAELLRTRTTSQQQADQRLYAYLCPDPERDAAAQALLEHNQISVPTYHEQSRTFDFDCFSSLATVHDAVPVMYALSLGLNGAATCTCPDLQNRGGACKHLRAALLRLEHLRSSGISIPPISLPDSVDDACARNTTSPPSTSESDVPHVVQRAAHFVDEVLQESGDAFEGDEGTFLLGSEKGTSDGASETEGFSDAIGTSSGLEDIESEDEPASAPLAAVLANPPSPKPVSQSNANSASRGYQHQIVARVLHDLEVDGPKLRQLGEYLEDVSELVSSEVSRVQVAKEQVDVLAAQLSRLLIEPVNTTRSALPGSTMEASEKPMNIPSLTVSGAEPAPETASSRPPHPPLPPLPPPCPSTPPRPSAMASTTRTMTLPPPLRRKKRRASLVIFPASPEKSQKRQDSHSIH
uniref:Linoleate diol synthase n=1 Tax=Ganoderma boninense TaxID=34458 RepID=A0A5K1K092_9APHY|nr:Linoleate diol synthase [Ganoderma boninense]